MDLLTFIQAVDANWFHQINSGLSNSIFDAVMPALSLAGNDGIIWIVVGVLLVVFGGRDLKRAAVLMLISLFISFILGEELLKHIFQRPRPFLSLPDVILLVNPPGSYSFPSGHAANAFGAGLVLVRKVPRLSWPVGILALAIAFSRVYVGVHYPFDVIGGAVIGIACAVLVLKMEGKIDDTAGKFINK